MLGEQTAGQGFTITMHTLEYSMNILWKSLKVGVNLLKEYNENQKNELWVKKHSGEMELHVLQEDEKNLFNINMIDGGSFDLSGEITELNPSLELYKSKLNQFGIDFAIKPLGKKEVLTTDKDGNEVPVLDKDGNHVFAEQYSIYYRGKDSKIMEDALQSIMNDVNFERITKGKVREAITSLKELADERNKEIDKSKEIIKSKEEISHE